MEDALRIKFSVRKITIYDYIQKKWFEINRTAFVFLKFRVCFKQASSLPSYSRHSKFSFRRTNYDNLMYLA